ncbi:MAG: U32 family peptidase [Ruminococcus sp.]|nr:U32 family peptidase [Ruminococcus sp.]
MKSPEILAPAGNMESLIYALRSGADAVYAGGKRFSARSNAVNFNNEELAEAVRICHGYGGKFYLAVNTVISNDEAEDFCRYIKFTAEVGVDAYIVQDWGCAELIRRCVPNAVLHASTQMSIHTAEGTLFLGENGFSRVVPARELDKKAIRRIAETGIETEIFVHGALCMSVSGQCYMSAFMGSRSANRGFCGQACRLPFSSCGNPNANALSLKDLSLIPQATELAELNIDSLKIEGRMKRPEYTASAVGELKKSLGGEKPDMKMLRGIFSRGGFTDGYFSGERSDMFGVREKKDVTATEKFLPEIHEKCKFERKIYSVDFHAEIRKNKPFSLTATCGDVSVTVQGEIPEKAEKRSTDSEILAKQLSKLGDTVLNVGKISADIDGGLIVPVGKINAVRRQAVSEITEKIIKKNTPFYQITDYIPTLPSRQNSAVTPFSVRTFCRNVAQLKACADISEYVIADSAMIFSSDSMEEISEYREKIILSPPRFIADEEKTISRLREIKEKFGINRLLCHTPDSIAIGKKLGFRLHGNFTLNIFNSFSAEYMEKIGLEDVIVSPEMKINQIEKMQCGIKTGAVIYGNIPLMLTRNCPIKNEVGCKDCTRQITDRTGRRFSVVCTSDYVEILNTDCLYMADRLDKLKNISFGVVMLSDESPQQAKDAVSGKKPSSKITHGLYYRGI